MCVGKLEHSTRYRETTMRGALLPQTPFIKDTFKAGFTCKLWAVPGYPPA